MSEEQQLSKINCDLKDLNKEVKSIISNLKAENAELIRQNNDYQKEKEIFKQAYDRHRAEIEELTEKKRINCKRAEDSYNREMEVTKELLALKSKWGKVVQEETQTYYVHIYSCEGELRSIKAIPNYKMGFNIFPTKENAQEFTCIEGYKQVGIAKLISPLSLLKPETKQKD